MRASRTNDTELGTRKCDSQVTSLLTISLKYALVMTTKYFINKYDNH